MNYKSLLLKHGIITDIFDYEFLDDELISTYNFFESRFEELFKSKAEIFKINDCHFYFKNGFGFNAFAKRFKGYNLIGVTNGYVIHTSKIFHDNYFQYISLAGLKAEKNLSDAFAYLEENLNFKFSTYMMNCSIEFTFGHEFQHTLQFNSAKINGNYEFSENFDESEFSMQKHAWEFDADRFGCFDVLKYAFEIYRKLNYRNVEILRCLIYSGISSIIITRMLFYLNVLDPNQQIKVQNFYTKEFSHPHPFLRIFNILEFSVDSANDLFSELKIETQDMLNNTLNISNIFIKSFLPNQNPLENFFKMLDIESINLYNNELYEYAIKDEAIRNLLKTRRINFEE